MDPPPDEDAHVRQLIAGLPEREQNLLLLRYWIGMSHKEIAQALALPEGTVRRQCSEALEMFRERWGRG
jgi:RNA polymerase sigma factor (sigma-70 family)